MSTSVGFVVVALLVAALAALFDWRRGRVSNWVTLAPLPFAPVAHALVARGAGPISGMPAPLFFALASLVGAVLCAAVPWAMFRFRWAGGADVKLLATLGALLGPVSGLRMEVYALALAAFYAPARLAYDGKLFSSTGRALAFAFRKVRGRAGREHAPELATETLPLGPFVLIGTAASVLLPKALP